MPERPLQPPSSPRTASPALPPLLPLATPAACVGVELASVEENLALDEAFLEMAHEGLTDTVCVRTWMAAQPTVVLGSSGRLAEEVDLEACGSLGVRVIRRPSGGGTVLLGPGCLMWSVVVPFPAGPPAIEAIHAAVLEPLAAAITRLLRTTIHPAGDTVARWGTSDLAILRQRDSDAESGAAGPPKKVSGNAVRVRKHGVLYHGTLLDEFDLGLVARVLRHPPREPDYRGGRRHGEFLANLGVGRSSLEQLVRTAFGATVVQNAWPSDRVERLVRERYADAEWTARL